MKEFEGKKLLVLGGIKTECDIVKKAQEMGAYVIVADMDPNCPAKEFADKLACYRSDILSQICSYMLSRNCSN